MGGAGTGALLSGLLLPATGLSLVDDDSQRNRGTHASELPPKGEEAGKFMHPPSPLFGWGCYWQL